MFHAAELFGQNVHLFLTEPRRSPAAAGLPRPEAGSGAPEGLELSPWSVFLHECCRYPLHVASYMRTHPGSVPTVKQHVAAATTRPPGQVDPSLAACGEQAAFPTEGSTGETVRCAI